MKPTAYGLQPSSRSGIALIMSLGVLSVMLIMAVAFAVAMRTERLAAGNYADSVRARQLVQTGLTRALNDLANQLGANGLMSALGGTNYPTWIVTNSYTNQNVFSFGGTVITNQATNFVPRALWAAATNADQSGAANHWLAIDSLVYTNYGTNTYLASSNRLGAVKYLILNCSGLLDANFAGGMNRSVGTNTMEIAISNMPDFETGSAATFIANRATDYRYETLEELRALNLSAFNNTTPPNFTVYSHAPARYWYNNTTNDQVNLAGDVSQLAARRLQITDAFEDMGFSSYQAGVLYSNMVDYVDSDLVPSNYVYSVEPVPMISRMTFSSGDSGSSPGDSDVSVAFTLWDPFVSSSGGTYSFAASVNIAGTIFSFGPSVISNAPGQMTNFSSGIQIVVGLGPHVPTIISTTVKIGANSVDELKAGAVNQMQFTNGYPVTWECVDSRFNYDPNDPTLWKQRVGLGDLDPTNGVTRDYWQGKDTTVYDTDAAMHVANRSLQSVGELGYLAYAPWRTIKLYDQNLHRVLDTFAIGTNTDTYVTSDTIWRGRVNPHTRQADVLSAVFSNMPISEYPGQAASILTGAPLQAVVADIQANALIFDTNNALIFSYTNLSAFGRNLTASDFPAAADNELKREAIFRNTAGLFSTRQNLFTIIIEAMVGPGGSISRNSIRQRAVALVWRDPYTGEMFVRSIKWLRD